jgi:hypothetical protein
MNKTPIFYTAYREIVNKEDYPLFLSHISFPLVWLQKSFHSYAGVTIVALTSILGVHYKEKKSTLPGGHVSQSIHLAVSEYSVLNSLTGFDTEEIRFDKFARNSENSGFEKHEY